MSQDDTTTHETPTISQTKVLELKPNRVYISMSEQDEDGSLMFEMFSTLGGDHKDPQILGAIARGMIAFAVDETETVFQIGIERLLAEGYLTKVDGPEGAIILPFAKIQGHA